MRPLGMLAGEFRRRFSYFAVYCLPGFCGRYSMGLVIFTGLSIGTLFMLFVVPAMYIAGGQ